MKDFTKTQEKRSGGRETLKCNTCSEVVTVFGVQVGDPCVAFTVGPVPRDGDPESHSGSTVNTKCTGRYMKMDPKAADAMKRRTDGSA